MNVWLVSETEIWGDRRKPRVAAETPALAYAWLSENCRGNDNFEVEQVEFLSDVESDSWDFVRPDGAGERAWLHRSPIELCPICSFGDILNRIAS